MTDVDDKLAATLNQSFAFDPLGNRTETETAGTVNDDYETDAYNRLADDGTYTYTYDAEGNLEKRTDDAANYTTYTWDHRNRLVLVEDFNSSQVRQQGLEYWYDAFDRRIVMLDDTNLDGTAGNGSDVVEIFIYDDGAGGAHAPGGGNQILLQLDASIDVTDRYLWGPEPDQLLATVGRSRPFLSLSTSSKEPSRVEPPAPKVTET